MHAGAGDHVWSDFEIQHGRLARGSPSDRCYPPSIVHVLHMTVQTNQKHLAVLCCLQFAIARLVLPRACCISLLICCQKSIIALLCCRCCSYLYASCDVMADSDFVRAERHGVPQVANPLTCSTFDSTAACTGRAVHYKQVPWLLAKHVAARFSVAAALAMFLGFAACIVLAFLINQVFQITTGYTSGERNRIAGLRRMIQAEEKARTTCA